ncbi:MAG: threonine--tRNA ligase [Hydrogenophilus sp.]|nr:threonine--tRNA ligase [Hydrogenophilus sp.]
MVAISLPDGSVRYFEKSVTAAEVAAAVGPALAEAAVAARVNGRLVDLATPIDEDAQVEIVTERDPAGLEVIRHSTAHLLAHAVKQLYPQVQVTIGPVIENGFYYDFAFDRPFTPEDLEQIEGRMRALAAAALPVVREVWQREEAVRFFREAGEFYKAEIVASIPEGETISIYRQGDFVDLCRGPHVPHTGKLRAFKLTKVAGAYWRGDARNEQLQRIYGTAWASDQDLQAYLQQMAEAERRDHRRVGVQLDLFHFEEAAPGSVFWHPKGWRLFQTLISYMRSRQEAAGYVEINTPDVMDRSLWERSGHWENYRAHMFTTQTEDSRTFALKPMNCPGAVSWFKSGLHSYRDLPLRVAEFGKVHRYEPSGALHGLLRVRHFTQDDAHIFCTPEQMTEECREVVELILDIYREFGFDSVRVRLATRPDNRIGSEEVWDQLESALAEAVKGLGLSYELLPGEGAFYGPKLEFVLKDAIGREWQCGTLQVDMNLPERFDLEYVAEDNSRRRPVLLHRALFGSLERFIGILLEHYAGALPVWLAPVKAVVLPVSERHAAYARSVRDALRSANIWAEDDLRNEKITYKIREHSLQRIPYLLVVGDREVAREEVSVRARGGVDLGPMPLAAFVVGVTEEMHRRSPDVGSFGKKE